MESKALFKVALPLLLICMAVALLLSCVNILTRDVIAENANKEKESALLSLYPAMTDYSPVSYEGEGVLAFYQVEQDGTPLGYVIEVAPRGYGGEIDMLVAVTESGDVGGVQVISHSETAGLGSRATLPDYLLQYEGKSLPLVLGGNVDAVTGATVSSRAVRNGVDTALSAYASYKGVRT